MYRFPESPMVHLLITDEASELFKWNSQLSPPHPWQKRFWCSCGRWIYPYKRKAWTKNMSSPLSVPCEISPISLKKWEAEQQSTSWRCMAAQMTAYPITSDLRNKNCKHSLPGTTTECISTKTHYHHLEPASTPPPPLSPPWNKPTCLT